MTTTATAATAKSAETPGLETRRLAAFAFMVFGMFMAVLDIQIVAASLPQIQAGLSASADQISWVQTSYLIAEVIMIPLSGYLSRALSTRVLFTFSAIGFTIASLGCALSWSIESLVVMRALQGFIGGAMIPTVFATAFTAFPRERQTQVSMTIGLIVTLAPTIGPTLGGTITEYLSWHWLFLVNIAPGAFVALSVWLLADFDKPNLDMLKRFDFRSLFYLAVALGLLEYILEEGPGDDWFDDAAITWFSVISAVSAVAFLWRTLRIDHPIVDITAYRNLNFTFGSAASMAAGVTLFGLIYLLPLFLARVRDYSSIQVGETLFITGVAMFLAAPAGGFLSRRTDPRMLAAGGFAMLAYSTYSISQMTSEWGFWELFWPQLLRGAGLIFTLAPINVIALGGLEQDKVKNAAGLYNLTRNLGGALGLAVINTILTNRAAFHARILADQFNPGRGVVSQRLDALVAVFTQKGVANPVEAATKALSGILQREATTLAFADTLRVIFWLCVVSCVIMLLARRPKKPAGEAVIP